MDNRLDFFNTVGRHLETLTDDDSLLIISTNRKQGDLFFSLVGRWEDLSLILSDKEVVNHREKTEEQFKDIQKLILNTALNICDKDPVKLNKMLDGLINLKNIYKP